jgi:triacylglycerol lipase
LKPNPLLLLHGICDTARLFKRLRTHLEERGWEVHTLGFVPNDGTAGLDVLAQQVHDYIKRTFHPGQSIDLIGFSMGGIVGRYYLQRLGGFGHGKGLEDMKKTYLDFVTSIP